ncbi:hypothetical protein [Pseudolysinimonas sp.]|uniref:hypothetical protein n=1 Tax=Pseudolysinimonas sp. TaxID=2680009 RepID=UPI0037843FCD
MGLDGDLVVVDRDLDALEESLIHLSPDGILGGPVHLVTVPCESKRSGQRCLDGFVSEIGSREPFVDRSQP